MGLIYKQYLEGGRVYCCSECGTHLSTKDDIISRVRRRPAARHGARRPDVRARARALGAGTPNIQAFQGQHGRAFLFNTV